MPPLYLKWHNISWAIRIKLSPDAKIILYVISIFILLVLGSVSKTIDAKFEAAALALAAALVTGVVKDFKSNKLDVEVAEKGLGPRVTEIKNAAAGMPAGEPCADPGKGPANG